MLDPHIPLAAAIAALLWAAGLVVLVLAFVLNEVNLGNFGLYVTAGAMSVTLRALLCGQVRREHAAFQLGRDIGEAKIAQRLHAVERD